MLSPRVREIDLDDLDDLPDPCRGCMFWQAPEAPRGDTGRDQQAQDAWWRAVQLDWGTPAKGIWVDGRLVAFALYAPPLHVQRVRALRQPPSDDALVLATMWCHPDARGGGHARHLVQVLARDALSRGAAALEAYGSYHRLPGRCEMPGDALEALGFHMHRQDPSTPLYRMDLERTASWPQAVGQALGEVISSLQGRERKPARPALERIAPPQDPGAASGR